MSRNASRQIAIRLRVYGYWLRKRREAANLTQEELALLARTRQAAICRLEKAERIPRPATLQRIAHVLDKAKR